MHWIITNLNRVPYLALFSDSHCMHILWESNCMRISKSTWHVV